MRAKQPTPSKSPAKKKAKPAAGSKKKPASATKPAAPKPAARPRLVVLVGQVALPEDEARAVWQEFSRHMDENEGDLAGFAAKKGWQSVKPEHRQGQAVLVVTA